MKKKFLASLLSLCMIFSLMPMGVSAADAVEVTDADTLKEAAEVGETEIIEIIIDSESGFELTKVIEIKGNVTIKANSAVTLTSKQVDVLHVTGTLTLGENITINSESSILFVDGGTVNVSGANLISSSDDFTLAYVERGTLNISAGSVTGTGHQTTISLGDRAECNITGGTVEAVQCSAIKVKKGATVTVDGGTVKCAGQNSEGGFIAIFTADGGGVVNVESGTVTSEKGAALDANAGGKVNVTGGTITGGTITGDPKAVTSEDADGVSITGGKFTGNVDASYIAADNYVDTNGEVKPANAGAVSCAAELEKVIENGATSITLDNDIVLDETVVVESEVTVHLNGKNITLDEAESGDGVFRVKAGGKLTIEGQGIVAVAKQSRDGYAMAIWADGGNVTLNGGTYTNANISGTDEQYDLIYAKNGGTITINDGTSFIAKTPKWTLNQYDSSAGKIIVNGGSFYKVNPSKVYTEPTQPTDLVSEGFHACSSDDYWIVHGTTEVAAVAPTCTANGTAAHYVCPFGNTYSDASATTPVTAADLVVPATGHSFGGWYTVKEPICHDAGYEARVCTVCGETESSPLAATTHNFDVNGVCAICGVAKNVQAPSRTNPNTGVHF